MTPRLSIIPFSVFCYLGLLVQWSDQNVDLGSIHKDSTVSKQIWAINLSEQNWQIEHIQSACGCISTVESKRIIAPKDTFKLRINFKPQQKGEQHKSIAVYSNLGLFEIWLHAKVLN